MSTSDAADHATPTRHLGIARRLMGAVFLLVSMGASLALSLLHLGQLSLPGCAAASTCQELITGPMGTLGGSKGSWPVAFLGMAYFTGLLAAWLLCPRAGVPRALKWLVRLGLLGSLFWLGLMYMEDAWCLHCVAVHAGNIVFWALLELLPGVPSTRRSAAGFVIAAFLVSALCGLVKDQAHRFATHEGEDELAASIQAILTKSKAGQPPPNTRPGLQGPYRKGPEKAAIRLVVFTDYQCPHCRTLDAHIAQAMRGRSDVCFSVKHFPLCRECNPIVADPRKHPQACRAARVAEAAGFLGGGEAFWFTHAWLMRCGSEFTDEELGKELESIGLIHRAKFAAVMNSQQIKDRVRADVEEGLSLGLDLTPTVYVNGVELKGLEALGALPRAIDALTKENLPALTAAADHPETKEDRLVKEWHTQPRAEIPGSAVRWTLGPPAAPLRIVLFNDCLGPDAKQTTKNLTDAARGGGRTDVRLDCLHYPDADRNYDAARLLEAAGRVGGNDAFWGMHAWLLVYGQEKTIAEALAAAESLKLDRAKLAAEYDGNDTRLAVQADIKLGVSLQISKAPAIFINGRLVPLANPSQELFERLFAEELRTAEPGK